MIKRFDQIVLDHFPELSRAKIQSLIEKKKILLVNSFGEKQIIQKPGRKVESSQVLKEQILIEADEELQYVSRGALKLKAALDFFSISVHEKTCLDVGLCTGGFTDLLLQRGAQRVLGIDVGQGQVHPRLKKESRLLAFDKINAKQGLPKEVVEAFFKGAPPVFECIVVDVSFISLSLIVPQLVKYLSQEGFIITLVKPQFELSRKDLNKKGVVKDPDQIGHVLEKIRGVFKENGLNIVGHIPSPIEGENGNKEILLLGSH